MKKIMYRILAAIMLLSIMPLAAFAQAEEDTSAVTDEVRRPSHIEILDEAMWVSEVRIVTENSGNIKSFDVYLSLDGEEYTLVTPAEHTVKTDNVLVNRISPAACARYIKTVFNTIDETAKIGKYRVETDGKAAGSAIGLIGEGAEYTWLAEQPFVTSQSILQADAANRMLIDGDTQTICESETGYQGQYATALFDLKKIYQLDAVDVYTPANADSYADYIEVKVSTDGVNYTTTGFGINTNSRDGSETVKVKKHGLSGLNARYVKVIIHNDLYSDRLAVSEIDISGWNVISAESMGRDPLKIEPRVTLRQFSLAHIDWSAYPADGYEIDKYALYVEEEPFYNVEGMTPKAQYEKGTEEYEGRFAIYLGLEPEKTYYFAITPFLREKGEVKATAPVAVTTGQVLGNGRMGDIFGINYNPDEGGGHQQGHGEEKEENYQKILSLIKETGTIVRNRWWTHDADIYNEFAKQGATYHLFYHGPSNVPMDNAHGVWTFSSVNEPENGSTSASALGEKIRDNYKTLKKASPKSVLAEPSLAGIDKTRLGYLDALYQSDGKNGAEMKNSFDVLDIHPYVRLTDGALSGQPLGAPEMIIGKIDSLRELMAKYNDADKPIMFTEIGWTTADDGNTGQNVSLDVQSDYLARIYLISAAKDIKMVMWYDFQDDGTNAEHFEHGFGLVDFFGIPKKSYYGYYNLSNMMKDAVFVKEMDTVEHPIYSYRFWDESKNKYITAMWAADGQERVFSLKTTDEYLDIYRIDGFAQRLNVKNGNALTGVNGTPLLVMSEHPISIEDANFAFSINKNDINVKRGETIKIGIKRDKLGAGIHAKIEPVLSDGWKFIGDTDLNENLESATLTFSVPFNEPAGERTIPICVTESGRTLTTLPLRVNVQKTTEVSVRPRFTNEQKWCLEVTVKNISDDNIEGTVSSNYDVYCSLKQDEPVAFGPLQPGESQKVLLPFKDFVWRNKAKTGIVLRLNDGYETKTEESLDFTCAVNDSNAVKIDGMIGEGEWDNAAVISMKFNDQLVNITGWGGYYDLGAEAKLKWDEEYFYMLCDVKDNIFYQANTDSEIWRGDSVQFAIDIGRNNGIGSEQYHEISFSLTKDNVTVWRGHAPAGFDEGRIKSAVAKATKSPNGVTYEVAIPWSQLLPDGKLPAEEKPLGFSMLVNDNDASGRRGWIQYMSGIGASKKPNLFGDLYFVKSN